MLADRLAMLEAKVWALMESPTEDAQEFLVRDERRNILARLEVRGHTPSLTFYDHTGTERLKLGLRTDATPALWVEGREIPLEKYLKEG